MYPSVPRMYFFFTSTPVYFLVHWCRSTLCTSRVPPVYEYTGGTREYLLCTSTQCTLEIVQFGQLARLNTFQVRGYARLRWRLRLRNPGTLTGHPRGFHNLFSSVERWKTNFFFFTFVSGGLSARRSAKIKKKRRSPDLTVLKGPENVTSEISRGTDSRPHRFD